MAPHASLQCVDAVALNLQCCDFKETANSLQKASALGTDFFFSIESHQFFPNDIMPEYSQMQESLVIKAIFRNFPAATA